MHIRTMECTCSKPNVSPKHFVLCVGCIIKVIIMIAVFLNMCVLICGTSNMLQNVHV